MTRTPSRVRATALGSLHIKTFLVLLGLVQTRKSDKGDEKYYCKTLH